MFEEFGFDYRIVIGVIAIAWLINYVIAPFLFWRIYRRKHTQGGKANMGRAALLIILAVIALVAWVGKRVAGGLSGKKYDNTISGEIDATFEKTADRVHGLNAKWEVAKKRAVERVEKKTTEKVGQNLQEDEKSPQEIEDKAAQLSPTNSDQYEVVR